MFNILKLFKMLMAVKALLGLAEPIKEMVHVVEQPGNGPAKKAAVLVLVDAAVAAGEGAFGVNLPNDMVHNYASTAIDVLVSVENLAGRLKKPDPINSKVAKKLTSLARDVAAGEAND